MSTLIDTSTFSTPQALEAKTFETIVSENIAQLQQLKPDYKWLESDDYMLLIQAFSYRELHLRQEFNQRLASTLLLKATGTDLDAAVLEYGVQRLANETDQALLQRTLQSLDSFSTAGSQGSYEYHAKSVGAHIESAKAVSPEASKVTVYVANYTRELEPEEITAVANKLSEPDIHPLCFEHTVVQATTQNEDLAIDVYLADMGDTSTIEPILQTKFARNFAIHESLSVFEIVNNCNVAGVTNVVPTSHPTGIVPAVGKRLVLASVTFAFKAAVTSN